MKTEWKRLSAVCGERGAERTFAAPRGYPMVSVTATLNFMDEPGMRVSAGRKDHAGDWWHMVNVPVELIPELIEMLQEVVAASGKGDQDDR